MIGIATLMLFGPKRLPEIARLIGRATSQFQRAVQDFKGQLMEGAEDAPESPADESGDAEQPPPEDYADKPSHTKTGTDPSGPPEGSDRADPPRAG